MATILLMLWICYGPISKKCLLGHTVIVPNFKFISQSARFNWQPLPQCRICTRLFLLSYLFSGKSSLPSSLYKGLLWPTYRHGVINSQLRNVAKSPDVGHNIRQRACVFGMVTMASTKRSVVQLEKKKIFQGLALYVMTLLNTPKHSYRGGFNVEHYKLVAPSLH